MRWAERHASACARTPAVSSAGGATDGEDGVALDAAAGAAGTGAAGGGAMGAGAPQATADSRASAASRKGVRTPQAYTLSGRGYAAAQRCAFVVAEPSPVAPGGLGGVTSETSSGRGRAGTCPRW